MSSPADTINPSGKRAIDEMREYAAELPERIGPCFGRDVVQMLDALEAENQRLRDALEKIAQGESMFTAEEIAGHALDGMPSAAE